MELYSLTKTDRTHTVAMQRIPSHGSLVGSETADRLAKEESREEQVKKNTTNKEVKAIMKAKQHQRCLQQNPDFSA